ncbi:MAG: hypothetical protein AAGG48_18115 [Planctomycetota bacterium]
MNRKPKIGQGALKAFGRQGLKELGRALQALPSSIPFVEEPGQIGTATTQAVSQQTGVSQPVEFSKQQSQGFSAMNVNEPEVDPQADVQAPAPDQPERAESILDTLTENAAQMAQAQEMERAPEIEP